MMPKEDRYAAPFSEGRGGSSGLDTSLQDDCKREVLILGASNEIQRQGYVQFIGNSSVSNASVGGCGSLAGVVMLDALNYPASRYALLNYELNEHLVLKNALRTEAEVQEIWDFLISKIWETDGVPIALTLPRSNNEQIMRTKTCDLHRAIAIRHGIPFLDVAELFVRVQQNGGQLSSLMTDGAHISPAAHELLGKLVTGALDYLDSIPRKTRTIEVNRPDFHVVWATDVSDKEPIKRASSLSTSEMIAFDASDRVEVTLPGPGFELVGVSLNRKSMGATMISEGFRKTLGYEQAGQSGFMRVVADIKTRKIGDNKIELRFDTIDSGAPTEPTLLSRNIPDPTSCNVEIECLLFRSSGKQSATLQHEYCELADCDLLNVLDTRGVEEQLRGL